MREITTNKAEKGSMYIVLVDEQYYYTVMQHGQRTWVANCISHNRFDKQFFTGNGYAVMESLGSGYKVYIARNIVDFRKGVMAVVLGQSPSNNVFATDMTDKYVVEVGK